MFIINLITKRLFSVLIPIFLTACYDADNKATSKQVTPQQTNIPVLEVYKTPTCGCCRKWISHLEENGFHTVAHNRNNLSSLKAEKGVKPHFQSCHTSISRDGFVFEGHIPAKYIQKFLAEKPEGAIGLAVPAMPLGSPGMEAGGRFSPYAVLILMADGSSKPYAQIETLQEQYQ
ncbi:DUF411 domain-containing protein [Paremcibacter congregatus]|uniref:DUF411 domain-containing protein n=1 Tax=Paremcibacter congregatus TaxID=2043170 RepID=UPI0030EC985A|tara:strand:- start:113 stop:637 length:525 start_codon:yes stop_codon:yes gene_type:complete